jgi:hypothetical protein
MKNNHIFFILIFISLILILTCDKTDIEPYINKKELYDKLMGDYSRIFPDGNRNACGAQFYHHIVSNLDPSIEEYNSYNKYYCSVSGSPIDHEEKRFDKLVVKDLNDNKFFGDFYRCCWPCVCDVMKYVRIENHTINLKGKDYGHYVLTIGDPCFNEKKIPKEVSCFKCSNKKTINAIHTKSGRIIIGVIYNVEEYDENKYNKIITDVMGKCEERLNTEPDDLVNGMGDIFVKLALVNSS